MWKKFVCAVLFGLVGNAWAGANDVVADNAWLRESVPGQDTASLQLNVTSIKPAKLVRVSSPAAASVRIERLSVGRGKAKTHVVSSLNLPGNRTVVFGDSGVALILVGLKKELNMGDHVPVTLSVQMADRRIRKIEVVAEVKHASLSYKQSSGRTVHDHR